MKKQRLWMEKSPAGPGIFFCVLFGLRQIGLQQT
jgi:hypothetical protein